ncbi:MAG: hypothetical protein ABIN08_00915 [Caldimonas sp.]
MRAIFPDIDRITAARASRLIPIDQIHYHRIQRSTGAASWAMDPARAASEQQWDQLP